MNSLLYYYNNVQKMAAYRQAKRMQCGVKLGYEEKPQLSTSTTLSSNTPIPIGTSDFSIEYYGNAYGTGPGSQLLSNTSALGVGTGYFNVYGLNLGNNSLNWVTFSIPEGGNIATDSLSFNYSAPTLDEKFHLVITRSGKAIHVYIDNVLIASKEQTEVKDLGDLQLAIANSSDVGFVRVWNYALSADEIATLYNNGDPMGYVVPSNYKILGDTYLSDFSEGADGWHVTPLTDYATMTVSDGAVVVSKDSVNQNIIIGRSHTPYNVQISNYSVQLKFSEPLPSQVISVAVRPFNSISGVTLNISPDRLTASGIFINSTSKPNGSSLIIFRATGPVSISISSISFTPSICLAEYLPQNLMASRKGPEVEPTADTFEFGIDSPYYRNILPIIEYPYQCSYHVEYIVDELDIQSVNGSIGGIIGFGAQLNTRLSGDTYFGNFQSSDIGVVKTFTTTFLGNNLYGYVSLYAGNPATTEFRVRKLKVRIISIKPLTNITGYWLDSAKQLPLSDEYMEPLFQSIGGYDMTANGAPEILYNE